MKNDNHYTLLFVDLLSNEAEKLNKIHVECGNNIEETKKKILGLIHKRIGHGTSQMAYNKIAESFRGIKSYNKLMITMSSFMLAGCNLKVK